MNNPNIVPINRLLVLAHPDDEILWFNPKQFDKILFCFTVRYKDKFMMTRNRIELLRRHPLWNKIEILGLLSSLSLSEGPEDEKARKELLKRNIVILKEVLKPFIDNANIIYTHNELGEYGSEDHILISNLVKELSTNQKVYCPNLYNPEYGIFRKVKTTGEIITEQTDLNFYHKVKGLYHDWDCWTWHRKYQPMPVQEFYRLK